VRIFDRRPRFGPLRYEEEESLDFFLNPGTNSQAGTMNSLSKKLIYFVTRQTGSPHQLAGGMALGLWIGMTFPPGTQMIVAVALAAILQWNSLLAATATWITNPLTMPLIYPAQIALGCWLTGIPLHEIVPDSTQEFRMMVSSMDYPVQILVLLLLGSQASGIALAAAGYYLTWEIVRRYGRNVQVRPFHGGESFPQETHPQILVKILGEEGIYLSSADSPPYETMIRKNGRIH